MVFVVVRLFSYICALIPDFEGLSTNPMQNKTIESGGYLRWFLLLGVLWSILGGEAGWAQTRSSNLLLPEFQFHRKGEYDTVAFQIGLERALETVGLLEKEIDPAQYIVGPDDRFLLFIFTAEPVQYELFVTPDGRMVIPTVGVVDVREKNLLQVREMVRRAVQQVYRNAKVALALRKIRTFKVAVLGAVRKPSLVQATPADRISEAIERAGGLLNEASMRRIQLFRQDTVIEVDLYRFYAYGDDSQNPYLRGGDRIVVPYRYERFVFEVGGNVPNPDVFEYRPGDKLSTALRFAGGFYASANLDSVEIDRFTLDGTRIARFFVDITAWRGRLFAEDSLPGDIALQPGDRIFVRARKDYLAPKVVVIRGEVPYPGYYPINEGEERLLDVIRRAGGVTSNAYLEGAVLIRQQEKKIIDREFQRLSRIPPSEMTEEELRYYKARAREIRGLMAVDFKKLLLEGDTASNVLLRDQDSIYIPSARNYINVLGRVNKPGRIVYRPGLDYEDYIALAGGYGYRADPEETLIIKAKGEQFLAVERNYTLEPGDNILVPEKPETKFIEVFTNALSIATQLITIAGVILSVVRMGQ